MPGATATQKFVYPTGQDRPCDSWATWKAMAVQLDASLVTLDGDLDRTARAVPIAKVTMNSPLNVGGLSANDDGEIIFDAVEVDTDGMADLTRSPKVLVPKRPGFYFAIAHARWQKLDVGSIANVYINSGSSGSLEHAEALYQGNPAGARDDGAIVQGIVSSGGSSAYGLTVSYSGATSDDPTVIYAELSLLWIADL